jgi:hypothetical protein
MRLFRWVFPAAALALLLAASCSNSGDGEKYNPKTQFRTEDGCVYDKCGGKEYNPGAQYCASDSNIYYVMGEYDPETHFRHKYIDEELGLPIPEDTLKSGDVGNRTFSFDMIEKCGGKEYDPVWQECDNGEIKNVVCGGKKYNRKHDFCHKGKIFELCGGEYRLYYSYTNGKLSEIRIKRGDNAYTYNPETHFCGESCTGCCGAGDYDDRVTIEKCNGKAYNPEKEFCHNGNIIKICNRDPKMDWCGNDDDIPYRMGKYDPAKEFCHNNTMVLEKCGDSVFDPDKQECQNGEVVDR